MARSSVVISCVLPCLLAAAIAGTSALAGGGAPPATGPAAAALPAVGTETLERTIEDGGTGKYKAVLVSDTSIPTHTIFRPKDLSAFGANAKLPILAWGNGGCANSPSGHVNYLSEIASHGYLVVAIGPTAQGGGRGGGGGSSRSSQLLDAVNWAIAQNANPASRYHGKIDIAKIGVFGHSCGGLQALEVSADPRISTTIVADSGILNNSGGGPGAAPGGMPGRGPARGGAMGPSIDDEPLFFAAAPAGPARGAGGRMPGGPGGGAGRGAGRGGGGMGMPPLNKDHLTKLHAPVFYLLGGESDMAYPNGMDDFKRIDKVPVFVANKNVGHGGTFMQQHGGDWAMVSVAWFDWQLKGDAEAGKLFTGNPSGISKKEGWTVDKKNIP